MRRPRSLPRPQLPSRQLSVCSTLLTLLFLNLVAGRASAQHVANPFVGATQYVNPDYATEVKAAIAAQPAGSSLASQMAVVATYPTAVWMDHIGAIAGGSSNGGRLGLAQHITAALSQQKGSEPVLITIVIYDLPQRDCAALASNGEISIAANPPTQPLTGIETYEQNYITPIYNILQPYANNPKLRFVLIIEPDSLPNLVTNTGLSFAIPNCVAANDGQSNSTASMSSVYVLGIQYALAQFHSLTNVYQYLDVGQSAWLGWPSNFTPAVALYANLVKTTPDGFATIDGFISNTANYVPTQEPFMTATEEIGGNELESATFYQYNPEIDEADYDAALYQGLVNAGFPATIGFLIDTSRNGWGGTDRPTAASSSTVLNTFVDASKIDQRDDRGNWCNQQNSGLGVPPTAAPAGFFSQLLAFVWIKPPGESDGTYASSSLYKSGNADENCDPAHDNALANGFPTDALANPPSAGVFWISEFSMLVQNSYPRVPTVVSPGFSIAVPATSVQPGASATAKVTITDLNGFTGSVTLAASGLPSGITASFGTNPAAATSVLTLTASSSAASDTASVTISGTTGSITSSATFTLTVGTGVPAPNIASLNPSSGAAGSSVIIAGTNFGASQGTGKVSFGGTPAVVSSWSNTSITAVVPGLSPGAVSVIATVDGIGSNGLTFTVAATCVSGSGVGVGYWHTSGNKILDANGNTVRLAGVNWYGFETPDYIAHGLWAQDYKTILNDIKSLGYNVIRLPFSNQMVESNPVPTNFTSYANGAPANADLVGQTALEDMDSIIGYAGSIGLRVILDNHRSEAGESNEANGLWYTSAYPQANWVKDWQTLATRYSAAKFTFNGNPTVIGFDLRNEPHLIGNSNTSGACWTGDTATNGCPKSLTTQNWPVAAQTAGNAVQAINAKLLIFVEGNDCYSGVCAWQGENLLGVGKYPVVLGVANQLVYSAHDYGPNLYGQPWFNSSTTPASLNAIWNQFWGYIGNQGIAPVWLGEFGTDQTNSDIENSTPGSQGQWFQSLVSYLSTNPTVNWTYWALNGEDTYGLLDNNYGATPASSLKQSLLASLQFPLGGSGSPTKGFSLSTSASSLTLQQSSSVSDTISVKSCSTVSVTLAATGLPKGVTALFGTSPTTGSSLLTLMASSSAATGTSTVTITGTADSLSASTTIKLTVKAVPKPSFTLSPSTANLTATQGSHGSSTISVVDAGGFTGSVTLAASGLPTGVAASFGTNPTTGSSVLTLTANSTAATGAYTVTVKGTSGALTGSTNIALTVSAPVKSGFACHITYAVNGSWPGGFIGAITINNTGTTAISNWTVTWTYANGQTINNLWNGNLTQNNANVTVTNMSYNGSIPAGGNYAGVGFTGTWNNTTNTAPASFAVNGTACH